MKVGTVLAVVVLAAAAVAGTYWIARSDTASPGDPGKSTTALDAVSEEPTPSKTGPHPKVVLPETTYAFGAMRVGETRRHVFVVRNEGQAPLRLGKPVTTCQCTISQAAKSQIPPGGEGTITLEWKPVIAIPEFDKGAMIRTNDPEMPEITLRVVGVADIPVRVEPEGSWQVGEIAGDTPSDSLGLVFSRLNDDLKIESITSSNPLLTAQTEPLPDDLRQRLQAKSGYKVRTKVAAGIPIGKFVETLTFHTNSPEKEFQTLKVEVTGTRHGPIQILPTPGTRWSADAMAVDLGRFPSSAGTSGALSLFVAGLPQGQDLRFETIKSDVPYLKAELKKDEGFKSPNRQRYVLTFTVPPNSPPATHRSTDAAHVDVTTNHPDAKEMKFRVSFISTP
jgi:hypothetical protein